MKTMINYKENKLAFINARLLDPKSGMDTIGKILIENKIIKSIITNKTNKSIPKRYKIIDCKKICLMSRIN